MLLCKRVWYQGWTPKYCPGIYYLGFLAVHAFISFVVSFALFSNFMFFLASYLALRMRIN